MEAKDREMLHKLLDEIIDNTGSFGQACFQEGKIDWREGFDSRVLITTYILSASFSIETKITDTTH